MWGPAEAAWGSYSKNVDMMETSGRGSSLLFSTRGSHHVHELSLPRIWGARLRPRAHGVRRRRGPLHNRTAHQRGSVLGLREPTSDPQGRTDTPVSRAPDWDAPGLDRVDGAAVGVQAVRDCAAGRSVLRSGPTPLHDAIRTLLWWSWPVT